MSDQSSLIQSVELRDTAGRSLGFFRSEDAIKTITEERDRLLKELAEVKAKLAQTDAECVRLRDALTEAKREREEHLQWVYSLTPNELPFSPDELANLEKNSVPFEQVFVEIEQAARGSRNG